MSNQTTSEYFNMLSDGLEKAMQIAGEAKSKGFDPKPFVEVIPAEDVAGRVEGIVGPKGIASKIRELEKKNPRDMLAFEAMKEILDHREDYGLKDIEKAIGQAVRTGVAILTEGVLVAPTEGISKIKICKNPDGSEYLSIYFAGPIRSAGGTVAAQCVVLADAARQRMGIADFRPTDDEIERYVEECNIYDSRVAHLQYHPPEDDIRHIVRNCAVCIDGDPTTKDIEVSVHKSLARVETNNIRGGICLVICEGIAQKAAKVMKYTKKIGLNWGWIESLVKVSKKEGKTEAKPDDRFLDELVAGRPIFSYPNAKGGFRLRYGRTRMTGIAAKAIHPAAMVLLDDFPAIGTQLKVERPGKGCVVTPCDTIDGPIVKLVDGSVVQVNSIDVARTIRPQVTKLLFLGDMLITYGDFNKANYPLIPGGYCEEQWLLEVQKASQDKVKFDFESAKKISFEESAKLCAEFGVALAPRWDYFWHDVSVQEIKQLAEWLCTGKLEYEWFKLKDFRVEASAAKAVLEDACIPHKVEGKFVVFEPELALAVLTSLGILASKNLTMDKFNSVYSESKETMQLMNELAGFLIKKKAPIYIGSRMGRPEKAKERMMKPAPHVLFPVGKLGGKTRSILKAFKAARDRTDANGEGLKTELARLKCPTCKTITFTPSCPICGARTIIERVCPKCGRADDMEKCPACGVETEAFDERSIDLVKAFNSALSHVKTMPDEMKGVEGLISELKIPEPLEKGLLRAKHNVFLFRDGTIRFDATDVPLTHFYPREIGVSVERLRELGYTQDLDGKDLTDPNQLLELKPQDVLLSDRGADYFLRVCHFIDDLLIYLYGLAPYYNAKVKTDLVGQLAITLSPHTSCGVLSRIIGFTRARVGFAHPYMICARRRNTDGDEDAIMLLMDALLNFSRSFLPTTRGGQMDTPLVMSKILNPKEVDDEVHVMEVCSSYPLALYEAAENITSPTEVEIELVKSRLGKDNQYYDLRFTHNASDINMGPIETRYVQSESMIGKVDVQFALCEKIRAVNLKDSAERLILNHFLPDLYGNLRAFSRQNFRCVDCNASYRRVPLKGACRRCGGKLVLTVSKGSIEKYLKVSQQLVAKYGLPKYLEQRLLLLERDINSVFEEDPVKQFSLESFM